MRLPILGTPRTGTLGISRGSRRPRERRTYGKVILNQILPPGPPACAMLKGWELG